MQKLKRSAGVLYILFMILLSTVSMVANNTDSFNFDDISLPPATQQQPTSNIQAFFMRIGCDVLLTTCALYDHCSYMVTRIRHYIAYQFMVINLMRNRKCITLHHE